MSRALRDLTYAKPHPRTAPGSGGMFCRYHQPLERLFPANASWPCTEDRRDACRIPYPSGRRIIRKHTQQSMINDDNFNFALENTSTYLAVRRGTTHADRNPAHRNSACPSPPLKKRSWKSKGAHLSRLLDQTAVGVDGSSKREHLLFLPRWRDVIGSRKYGIGRKHDGPQHLMHRLQGLSANGHMLSILKFQQCGFLIVFRADELPPYQYLRIFDKQK